MNNITIGGRTPTIEELENALAEMREAEEKAKSQAAWYPTKDDLGRFLDADRAAVMTSSSMYTATGRHRYGMQFPTKEDAVMWLLTQEARAKGRKWVPKIGDTIWAMNRVGDPVLQTWVDSDAQRAIYNLTGVFRTKEDALDAYTPEVWAALIRPPVVKQ